jgi:hypothetical protein
MRRRPQLLEEQSLQVVQDGADTNVLLITGMRDKAPVASYSHLVPASRLPELFVATTRVRGGRCWLAHSYPGLDMQMTDSGCRRQAIPHTYVQGKPLVVASNITV